MEPIPSCLAERLRQTDVLIHLDDSTPTCLFRVLWRIIKGYGKTRDDLSENCPERFDWEFLWYVATFHRKVAPGIAEIIELHGHEIRTFRIANQEESVERAQVFF